MKPGTNAVQPLQYKSLSGQALPIAVTPVPHEQLLRDSPTGHSLCCNMPLSADDCMEMVPVILVISGTVNPVADIVQYSAFERSYLSGLYCSEA